jgi:hypothetical protein
MADEQANPPRTGLSGVPLAVATGAICIWIAFTVMMLLWSDSPDLQWARLTFVFSSVEAIAFAAAGALFGVTVQRERVKSAEDRAEANAQDAANGRALAAITIADHGDPREEREEHAGTGYQEESFGSAMPWGDNVERRHAAAARLLFPDLAALGRGTPPG